MISYHTIAARDLRVGDRMSRDAALALDHWYDSSSIGEDVTVSAVKMIDRDEWGAFIGEYVDVLLDDDDMSITARPDQRITVVRPRGA